MRLLYTYIVMNPKNIRHHLRKYNLLCTIRQTNPYRRMAKSLRTGNVASNLLNRKFEAYGTRKVLLTDIAYIKFQDGIIYLSTILDAYTKEALAHVLCDNLEIDFVLWTVKNLQRDFAVSVQAEIISHSDQGCHYTSVKFITLVQDTADRIIMSECSAYQESEGTIFS